MATVFQRMIIIDSRKLKKEPYSIKPIAFLFVVTVELCYRYCKTFLQWVVLSKLRFQVQRRKSDLVKEILYSKKPAVVVPLKLSGVCVRMDSRLNICSITSQGSWFNYKTDTMERIVWLCGFFEGKVTHCRRPCRILMIACIRLYVVYVL